MIIPNSPDINGREGIGYWTRDPHDRLPNPIDFIDPNWDATAREAVAWSLRVAPIADYTGPTRKPAKCLLCGEDVGHRVLGLKDGPVWPESLSHYVAEHGVRPPNNFLYHVLCHNPNRLPDGSKIDFEPQQMTRIRVHTRIMLTPDPLSSNPPWNRIDTMEEGEEKIKFTGDMYGLAGDTIAKAMYTVLKEQPELIAKMDAADNFDKSYVLMNAVEQKWPGFDKWLGGSTGFMVGFAAQIACFVQELPPPPNPALWTISVKKGA